MDNVSDTSLPSFSMKCRNCERECNTKTDCIQCGNPTCDKCAQIESYDEHGQPKFICKDCYQNMISEGLGD